MIKSAHKESMEKVIRDGKVAVVVSSMPGAGWYTWNVEYAELLFHPKIVAMVEAEKQDEITTAWVERELGLQKVYCDGAGSLRIVWIDEGTGFTVIDNEGEETIITADSLIFIA